MHKTLPTNPSIHIYLNRINNRLVFKIKDGYMLQLQIPEAMKLFGIKKNLIDKTKIGENALSLKMIEIVLVQCSLVDN